MLYDAGYSPCRAAAATPLLRRRVVADAGLRLFC